MALHLMQTPVRGQLRHIRMDRLSQPKIPFLLKRFASDAPAQLSPAASGLEERLRHVMNVYEDFIGLKEVKEAQNNVVEAERNFKKVQEKRITQQHRMLELQKQLREIHAELDKTLRGEDRYLQLVTKEHAILKEDRMLLSEFRLSEKQEYDCFSQLSFHLRDSHSKERAQAERTKYWSIIGSVFGTVLGIIGTTISNHYRMKQLRGLVNDASTETSRCKDIILKIREDLSEQRELLVTREPESGDGQERETIIERIVHTNECCATEKLQTLEEAVIKYQTLNVILISSTVILTPLLSWLILR